MPQGGYTQSQYSGSHQAACRQPVALPPGPPQPAITTHYSPVPLGQMPQNHNPHSVFDPFPPRNIPVYQDPQPAPALQQPSMLPAGFFNTGPPPQMGTGPTLDVITWTFGHSPEAAARALQPMHPNFAHQLIFVPAPAPQAGPVQPGWYVSQNIYPHPPQAQPPQQGPAWWQ